MPIVHKHMCARELPASQCFRSCSRTQLICCDRGYGLKFRRCCVCAVWSNCEVNMKERTNNQTNKWTGDRANQPANECGERPLGWTRTSDQATRRNKTLLCYCYCLYFAANATDDDDWAFAVHAIYSEKPTAIYTISVYSASIYHCWLLIRMSRPLFFLSTITFRFGGLTAKYTRATRSDEIKNAIL